MEKTKLKARIDLAKAKVVGDVSLGDTVKVVMVGRVVEMRGPEEGLRTSFELKGGKGKEEKYTYPGTLTVEFSKLDVVPNGAFTDPEEDD